MNYKPRKLVIVVFILLWILAAGEAGQQADQVGLAYPIVQIATFDVKYDDEGQIVSGEEACLQTGAIIHPIGLILTTLHGLTRRCGEESDEFANLIVILITERLGDPPVPRYKATLLRMGTDMPAELGVNYALIQIDGIIEGQDIRDVNELTDAIKEGKVRIAGLPQEFSVPFLKIGKVDSLLPLFGEEVVFLGYPETELPAVLTIVRGSVTSIRNKEGYFLVDIPFPLFGMSGSPIIANDGSVIGLIFAMELISGSFGFAIGRPIDAARPLFEPEFIRLNQPPVARFTFSPLGPRVGEPITFDAFGSYDPEGYELEFEWDFDNDGEYDAIGERVSYTFQTEIPNYVTLKVSDNLGLSDVVQGTMLIPSELQLLYFRAKPSVVFIQAGSTPGSGFIISSSGDILTARHVIAGAEENIIVTLDDGTQYNAYVRASSVVHDVALLKINARNLTPLELGNSDTLHVLDQILYMGFPCALPKDEPTADAQRINRFVERLPVWYGSEGRTMVLEDIIQTTGVAAEGMSGGPMLNEKGEVVGIIFAGIPLNAELRAIAFAIPINTAKRVLPLVGTPD